MKRLECSEGYPDEGAWLPRQECQTTADGANCFALMTRPGIANKKKKEQSAYIQLDNQPQKQADDSDDNTANRVLQFAEHWSALKSPISGLPSFAVWVPCFLTLFGPSFV